MKASNQVIFTILYYFFFFFIDMEINEIYTDTVEGFEKMNQELKTQVEQS